MVSSKRLRQVRVAAAHHIACAVVPDAGFDARWAAWVARGRVHEHRVRRRFVAWLSTAVVGAALVYGVLRW